MKLWHPQKKKIVRPGNVSRRGFLQALGITAVTALVPGLLVPAKPKYLLEFFAYEVQGIAIGNPALMARQAVDWIKQNKREEAFFRKIVPPTPISNDALDRCTPDPRIIRPKTVLAEPHPMIRPKGLSVKPRWTLIPDAV